MLSVLDSYMRMRMRPDLRADYLADFVCPNQYLSSTHGHVLDRHIEKISNDMSQCQESEFDAAAGNFLAFANTIFQAGAKPIIVMLPIHPRLQHLGTSIHEYARLAFEPEIERRGGVVIDARTLLGSSSFADGLHPNADGRAILSTAVGQALPPL